jgi:hypothetical protein
MSEFLLNPYPPRYRAAFASSSLSISHRQQRALRFRLPQCFGAVVRGFHVPRHHLNGQLRCGLYAGGSTIPCRYRYNLQPDHACKHWETCLHPVNSGRVGSPSDGASTTIHLISPYCPALAAKCQDIGYPSLALNRMEFPEGFSCRHSNPIRYVVSEASHQLHSA